MSLDVHAEHEEAALAEFGAGQRFHEVGRAVNDEHADAGRGAGVWGVERSLGVARRKPDVARVTLGEEG